MKKMALLKFVCLFIIFRAKGQMKTTVSLYRFCPFAELLTFRADEDIEISRFCLP